MSGLVELAQQLAQSVGSLSSRFMCSLLSFALFSRVSVICFYICCFFVFGSSICCTMRGLIKLAVHVLSSLCFICSLRIAYYVITTRMAYHIITCQLRITHHIRVCDMPASYCASHTRISPACSVLSRCGAYGRLGERPVNSPRTLHTPTYYLNPKP